METLHFADSVGLINIPFMTAKEKFSYHVYWFGSWSRFQQSQI